ncbi:DUF4926 domain-containing protein [Escherichia marmotae]|uniref:DUF4926 domain-containing protein n=1 Tax=Escherichia marmotae TaxID=1499973 RepID=A0A7L5X6L3_9ESCH|nr:DUF4926 domain-containing protein [Escherichia marmotae]MED8813926.1 DUF4926 domain-containing protein [Escherichia marmotae]MED8891459.1 DUF4926 domain-containing protein [Escherichia marmotae]MED9357143.1 DUF4926 domain-containing protein [Escherichia marmotae]QLP25941.1 DUF4926 domain-containing protein [Escherichia marmotae]
MIINDTVELLVDIPCKNLKIGSIGVIVELLNDKKGNLYEVEFCNQNGETLTTVALSEKQIKKYLHHSNRT